MKLKMLLLNALVFTMALLPVGIHAAGQPTGLADATIHQQTETNTLYCQGQFWGYQATITGWRQYRPYNALGDGYVQFSGAMQIGQFRLPMTYEGWTAMEFRGVLQTSQQTYNFKILDNTGGRMIIYEGRERLTAPATWGQFTCRWRSYN